MLRVNEAGWDRTLRVVIGLVLMYVGWGGVLTGVLGAVVGVIGLVLLVTGVIGWCPLYTVLGCATRRETP
jgi:hypothetical protein